MISFIRARTLGLVLVAGAALSACAWDTGGGCSERTPTNQVTACTMEDTNTASTCSGGTSNANYEAGPCPTDARVGRCSVSAPASGIVAARAYVRSYYSPRYADGDARDDCASRRDLHGPGTTVRYAPN